MTLLKIEPILRLIPGASSEEEWHYLVCETLAGERCIVPLLEELIGDPTISSPLRSILRRQLSEELDHVERYERLIPSETATTGYCREFSELVRTLPNLTLKLFALQTVLESISLGALQYRLKAMPLSPSAADDVQILRDEQGHVNFGMAFLGELRNLDGIQSDDQFRCVARQANNIFVRHFNGDSIADFMRQTFGRRTIVVNAIEDSEGMRAFRRLSAQLSAANRVDFFRRYRGTEDAH